LLTVETHDDLQVEQAAAFTKDASGDQVINESNGQGPGDPSWTKSLNQLVLQDPDLSWRHFLVLKDKLQSAQRAVEVDIAKDRAGGAGHGRSASPLVLA
jgi:hypothetical protein